jgi:hypothetical protein
MGQVQWRWQREKVLAVEAISRSNTDFALAGSSLR